MEGRTPSSAQTARQTYQCAEPRCRYGCGGEKNSVILRVGDFFEFSTILSSSLFLFAASSFGNFEKVTNSERSERSHATRAPPQPLQGITTTTLPARNPKSEISNQRSAIVPAPTATPPSSPGSTPQTTTRPPPRQSASKSAFRLRVPLSSRPESAPEQRPPGPPAS